METSNERSLKLPTFDGSHKKFTLWWIRFMGFAECHNFAKALQPEPESDLPTSSTTVIDESTEDGKKQAQAKKRNNIAMANFAQAFTSEGLMNILLKSMSAEWPRGKACLVVQGLFKKYQPQDVVTLVELRMALNKVSMKKNQDPATLFEQLKAIENKYTAESAQLDESEVIATILSAAPVEYQPVLTTVQLLKGDKVTVDDLEKAMTNMWRQRQAKKGKEKDEDEDDDAEIALGAIAKFCFKCKKKGHKAHECRSQGGAENKNKASNGKQKKIRGKCFNCGREGHRSVDCWAKEENKDKRPAWYKDGNKNEYGKTAIVSDSPVEFLLIGAEEIGKMHEKEFVLAGKDEEVLSFPEVQSILSDPNVWIGDTGATKHVSPHSEGLVNIRESKSSDNITMGNKRVEKASQVGDIHGIICDKYGNEKNKVKIEDVSIVPTSGYNLFSITKLMKNGWKLSGTKEEIKLTNDEKEIIFDICIPTPMGMLLAMYVKRCGEMANLGTANGADATKKVKFTYKKAHDILGHCNDMRTRQIARYLGWEIIGTAKPCEACSIAKAKQKNLPKVTFGELQVQEKERGKIHIDISTVKQKKGMPEAIKPNWRILVDARTQLKFSDFYPKKNDMVEPTCQLFKKWEQEGMPVKVVRLDNAGENKLLQDRCESKDWKLGIKFEFTARDTPQQNSLAEVAFATIANRGRAMMYQANIPYKLRFKVWTEAFKTATLLDGLVPIMLDGKLATRFEHWCGKIPEFAKHLRTWGEAGTVKIKTKTTPKLADRGVQCMFVGYSLNHPGDSRNTRCDLAKAKVLRESRSGK
jgi:hypothetical protein